MPESALPHTGGPSRPPRLARPQPVERAVGALVAAVAQGRLTQAEFWRTVGERGTPLVEADPDGDAGHAVVTFLWRGDAATRAVQVTPNKVGDPADPEGNLMERVPGTDVWHWSVRMRVDWQATYALAVDDGDGPQGARSAADGPAYWRWLRSRQRPDPLNPRTLQRRWGGTALSRVSLPGAPDDSAWQPRPDADAPRGTVAEHRLRSGVLGNERRVWSYEPAAGTPVPAGGLPVLVLLDGEMWQPELGVATLLDNLIADGRIPPVAALLPESLDADHRWAELTCRAEFVDFLRDELLPWAARRLPLTGDPARTVVAGQSLGGLAAAFAGVTAPGRFGAVLATSGSFWWPAAPDGRTGTEWLTGVIADTPRLPVRFRVSAGEQEWVALPANRRLRDTLAARGYDDAVYREFNGGHDYLWWRTELADGLIALLSPEPGSARDADPGADADPGSDADADPHPAADRDPDADSDPAADPGPGTDADPGPGAGADTDPGPGAAGASPSAATHVS